MFAVSHGQHQRPLLVGGEFAFCFLPVEKLRQFGKLLHARQGGDMPNRPRQFVVFALESLTLAFEDQVEFARGSAPEGILVAAKRGPRFVEAGPVPL